jgi:hypothetical protein
VYGVVYLTSTAIANVPEARSLLARIKKPR